MTAPERELITDEIQFMQRVVPLAGARVIELGCGKAELSRRLLGRGLVSTVTALEVDHRQHAQNITSEMPAGLTFIEAGAQQIPRPDAAYDLAIMLKSLHHVPVAALDSALHEVRRVLVRGGWLYVSEPVYAGEFNEIVKLFHDEGVVRAAAYAALQRAVSNGLFEAVGEHVLDTAMAFRDYDDFVERVVRVTHTDIVLPDSVSREVRRRFGEHMTDDGARFVRQMRVNVLRRPPTR
jgi:ubiquinone/menaquinone biosynthesis C-methylase UbiE